MKINVIYFSATGGTAKVAKAIANGLQSALDAEIVIYDFTLPSGRVSLPQVGPDDISVVATPVYAGRVPNLLLKYITQFSGQGSMAISVVTYGNRNFDDALIELNDILVGCNFNPVAAAAFVAQHSFSETLAAGRPSETDLSQAYSFGVEMSKLILSGKFSKTDIGHSQPVACNVKIPGRSSAERQYYQPKDAEGNPIDIRKVKPLTTSSCTGCGHCAAICPMEAIDSSDFTKVPGICIKCNACIKECPQKAKYFDDLGYLYHKEDLERRFSQFKENSIFGVSSSLSKK